MSELLEILNGLKSEICPLLANDKAGIIISANFDRAIEIVSAAHDEQSNPQLCIAYLRGKVEAYENQNALTRQQ